MLTLSQKKYLIQMGAKAPSGGNMQPWRIDFDKKYYGIEDRSNKKFRNT
jgi:hypothetical protein